MHLRAYARAEDMAGTTYIIMHARAGRPNTKTCNWSMGKAGNWTSYRAVYKSTLQREPMARPLNNYTGKHAALTTTQTKKQAIRIEVRKIHAQARGGQSMESVTKSGIIKPSQHSPR